MIEKISEKVHLPSAANVGNETLHDEKVYRNLVFFIIGVTSCNDYKEVQATDIEHAFILNSSATFKGFYYKGSDNTYHYFASNWDFQKDKYFILPVERLTIESKYKTNLNDKELQIDLLAPDNEYFVQNEFYKLFIVKTHK